jgi:hypothetical protein
MLIPRVGGFLVLGRCMIPEEAATAISRLCPDLGERSVVMWTVT